jgi:hypothetical protein
MNIHQKNLADEVALYGYSADTNVVLSSRYYGSIHSIFPDQSFCSVGEALEFLATVSEEVGSTGHYREAYVAYYR